ncbi:MAG: porin family protein [Kiritimatiellae bacterium]|nr:porin family protein [Kiritimatiellia bacterium]
MNKWIAIALATALAAPAMAGGGFAVYGTYADMKDFDDAAYGGGLKLQADVVEQWLGVELRVQGLTGYGGDDPATEDSRLVSGEANLRLMLPVGDVLRLYIGAGAGYYVFPEYESKAAIGESLEPDIDPEDVWGYFGVAGVEWTFSPSVGLFAEAKYQVGEVEKVKIDDVEVDEGGDFSGLGVNAGILFRF